MIKKSIFRHRDCIILENDKISVTVVPSLGGKIVSFKHKSNDFELMFLDNEKSYDDFEPFDDFTKSAFGFDDTFPNIDEENFIFNGENIKYPDHGEVWTLNFDYEIIADKLKLSANSIIFEYTFEKILSIKDEKLNIAYNITSSSSKQLPCIWTMHCLINCEEDMKLNYPKSAKKLINIRDDSKYLGKFGTIHDILSSDYNFNGVFSKNANKCEKVYVANTISDGNCGATYPSKNIEFITHFDYEFFKYLGFWITEGGFKGDYNCAMEPSTGFYDKISIAHKNNSLLYLDKNHPINFELTLELRKLVD